MILYTTSSDEKSVNKVLNKLADINNFKMKDDVNILHPIIILSNENALYTNYVYIKKFKRYYFVTDIIAMNENTIMLKCDVDVLYTYKKQILNLTTFVERQENSYSPYIVDNELVTQCKREVRYSIIGTLPQAQGNFIALTVSGGTQESEVRV